MKTIFALVAFLFFGSIGNAQQISIKDKKSRSALKDILVIRPGGSLVGNTDIGDKITLDSRSTRQYYILNSPLIGNDTMFMDKIVDRQYFVSVPQTAALSDVTAKSSPKDYEKSTATLRPT